MLLLPFFLSFFFFLMIRQPPRSTRTGPLFPYTTLFRSEPIGGWKIIALIPQIIEPYRWTAGYLNGVIYFCHPRTGILELDLDTGVCQPIQATGLPSQPRAITVN